MSSVASTKKPPPTQTRLGGEALVETIDGPVEIIRLVGKSIPVLTRLPNGALGFRMMREVREVESAGPLLEVTNDDGQTVRVGRDHVFVRRDGTDVKAANLVVGDRLDVGWSYPEGYAPPDTPEYSPVARGLPWQRSVCISRVEEVDPAPLFGCTVNETRSFFLTFGARSRAQV